MQLLGRISERSEMNSIEIYEQQSLPSTGKHSLPKDQKYGIQSTEYFTQIHKRSRLTPIFSTNISAEQHSVF